MAAHTSFALFPPLVPVADTVSVAYVAPVVPAVPAVRLVPLGSKGEDEAKMEHPHFSVYSPDFTHVMKRIEHHYSNEFCEWDDAVNSVVLRIFGSRSTVMDSTEAKKFEIDAEDICYFLQQLIDRGGESGGTGGANKHLYGHMRNIFLPLCMYRAPRILGDLLMTNKTNAEFVNLLFDTTRSENFQDYFPDMLPQEIKEIYFAQFPTPRLLQSITNFLSAF